MREINKYFPVSTDTSIKEENDKESFGTYVAMDILKRYLKANFHVTNFIDHLKRGKMPHFIYYHFILPSFRFISALPSCIYCLGLRQISNR